MTGREPESSVAFRVLIPLLLSITAIGVVDLILDAPETLLSAHVIVDILLVVVSLGGALYLWVEFRLTERSLERTQAVLRERSTERDAWRRRTEDLLEGLGRAADELFAEWGLTDAERQTALLLLKGHSHKRIARLTGRSDRTVRQHAVAVYRKSGLGGRAALSGFFLEHLALPDAALPADDDSERVRSVAPDPPGADA
ncbi:MAG: helix-turn-helix domain-containing protein [Gemmatimonadota bacterium]|nr:helix-turn-helix domain-containing protein [Gemmatimonadota bacterium]